MSTKKCILELLERQRGKSISGEQLAAELGISRNAVWKAIKELQKDGYSIAAVTNKGYCLSEENDIISAAGIRPFLSESGMAYADNIHIFDTLRSTNGVAKEMAVAGAEHGTVVIADDQTEGRGRYSRSFFSQQGDGLYMSIILRPGALALSFDDPAYVTEFSAVSVCEAIEAISERTAKIKWVNDIYIEGKKVCGILTEAVTDFESGGLDWIVIGIGINVYIRHDDFPPQLQPLATSVYPDKETPGVRNRLAAEIINRILGCNAQAGGTDLIEKYRKRLMMLGEEVTVIQGRSEYRATALDVDGSGHLIVRNESGELITLSSGEVRIRQ